MTNENNDAVALLASIVENEGGTYNLPISAFEAVVAGQKGVSVESSDGGQTFTLTLVATDEVESA